MRDAEEDVPPVVPCLVFWVAGRSVEGERGTLPHAVGAPSLCEGQLQCDDRRGRAYDGAPSARGPFCAFDSPLPKLSRPSSSRPALPAALLSLLSPSRFRVPSRPVDGLYTRILFVRAVQGDGRHGAALCQDCSAFFSAAHSARDLYSRC